MVAPIKSKSETDFSQRSSRYMESDPIFRYTALRCFPNYPPLIFRSVTPHEMMVAFVSLSVGITG